MKSKIVRGKGEKKHDDSMKTHRRRSVSQSILYALSAFRSTGRNSSTTVLKMTSSPRERATLSKEKKSQERKDRPTFRGGKKIIGTLSFAQQDQGSIEVYKERNDVPWRGKGALPRGESLEQDWEASVGIFLQVHGIMNSKGGKRVAGKRAPGLQESHEIKGGWKGTDGGIEKPIIAETGVNRRRGRKHLGGDCLEKEFNIRNGTRPLSEVKEIFLTEGKKACALGKGSISSCNEAGGSVSLRKGRTLAMKKKRSAAGGTGAVERRRRTSM